MKILIDLILSLFPKPQVPVRVRVPVRHKRKWELK